MGRGMRLASVLVLLVGATGAGGWLSGTHAGELFFFLGGGGCSAVRLSLSRRQRGKRGGGAALLGGFFCGFFFPAGGFGGEGESSVPGHGGKGLRVSFGGTAGFGIPPPPPRFLRRTNRLAFGASRSGDNWV